MPQNCLVRLPAAVKAPAGWRNACTRAHTSSANAPSTSAKKSQPCSHPIIPTRGVYGPPRSVVGGQEVAGLTGAEAGGLEEVDGEGPGEDDQGLQVPAGAGDVGGEIGRASWRGSGEGSGAGGRRRR